MQGFTLAEIHAVNPDIDEQLRAKGLNWTHRLPPGTVLNIPAVEEMENAQATATLTASELAGLQDIATRARSWSYDQLVTWYQAYTVHGDDWGKVSQTMQGEKTIKECSQFLNNWNLRKPPIKLWLQSFKTPGAATPIGDWPPVLKPAPRSTRPPAVGTKRKTHTVGEGCRVVQLMNTAPAFEGLTLLQVREANPKQEAWFLKRGQNWRYMLPTGTVLNIPDMNLAGAVKAAGNIAPSTLAGTIALSEAERVGLMKLAARSPSWTFRDMSTLYRTLKAHGEDASVKKIVANLKGAKSRTQVAAFLHDWKTRRRSTMVLYFTHEADVVNIDGSADGVSEDDDSDGDSGEEVYDTEEEDADEETFNSPEREAYAVMSPRYS